MKRVYVYCEGQTEETFINTILAPYFYSFNIQVMPIICATKRTKKAKYRGGVTDYFKIKNELTLLCKGHPNEMLTTMFDYYAMPTNTPGIENSNPDIFARIEQIEREIEQNIGMPNLFFGLMLHEFEALLFSQPEAFSAVTSMDIVTELSQIRNSAVSPEHINNSPHTAPSKRIEALIPNYAKVKNGAIVSKEIGIHKLLDECRHFARWIEKIKNC